MSSTEEILPDFYDLLETNEKASGKELQRAFRRQAIKYHPDRNHAQEAVAKFHLLTVALETLTNPEQRRKYDAIRAQRLANERRKNQVEGERRAWINELEKNEREASRDEHSKKRKWKQSTTTEEQLSHEGAEMRAALTEQRRQEQAQRLFSDTSTSTRTTEQNKTTSSTSLSFASKDKTLKVRFRAKARTEKDITSIFSRFGPIKDVVYKQNDQRRTQYALIEFAGIHDAFSASCTSLSEFGSLDVRGITWAYDEPPSLSDVEARDGRPPHASTAGSRLSGDNQPRTQMDGPAARSKFTFNRPTSQLSNVPDTATEQRGAQSLNQSDKNYESLVLLRMRQKQRKKELLSL